MDKIKKLFVGGQPRCIIIEKASSRYCYECRGIDITRKGYPNEDLKK